MKITYTMASETNASRPQRRFYSSQLKCQVTQECRQSGASVVGVALSHGINANIVHRLHQGHFTWPSTNSQAQASLSRAQLNALLLGLPWQRIGKYGITTLV